MDEIVAMFKQHGNNIGAIESLLANQGHAFILEVYADHTLLWYSQIVHKTAANGYVQTL